MRLGFHIKKLRWRLFALLLVTVGLVFAAIGVWTYFEAEARFITNRANQAHESVIWALTNAEPVGNVRVKDIGEVATKLSETHSPDYSFFLLDTNGLMVSVLGQGQPTYIAFSEFLPDLPSQIAARKEPMVVVSVKGEEYRTLVHIMLVSDPKGTLLGAIQVEVRLDEADLALQRLRLLLTTSFALALLAVATIWFFLTRSALRPLDDIARTSGHVAEGDFHVRVNLPRTRDEIYEAAAAYNGMLEYVETSIAKEKKLQEQMRRFVADASHEMRSPLTVILGYLDVLLRGAKDNPADLQKALEGMQLTASRMSRMTNDLLTMSKLDAGISPNLEVTELDGICRKVFETAAAIADNRQLEFQAGGPMYVSGDAELLSRAIWNLLENAIRYTPSGSKIVLATQREANFCIVSVKDNGEGIPSEHLPRLFERFYRADPKHPGGAGLGLAIVKSIVDAHGGAIEVASTSGKGTTFTIRLPLVPDKE